MTIAMTAALILARHATGTGWCAILPGLYEFPRRGASGTGSPCGLVGYCTETEMGRYLITSALPYINGIKHLGNLAGSMLPADVHARFRRMHGHEVLFRRARHPGGARRP